jgi:hypothetical protein
VLRYFLMPGPSPTPRPRAKARPTPTPTTPTKTVLRRLGLGRASGLAPRSTIIVFARSRMIGFAQPQGLFGNVGVEDGERMMRERPTSGQPQPRTHSLIVRGPASCRPRWPRLYTLLGTFFERKNYAGVRAESDCSGQKQREKTKRKGRCQCHACCEGQGENYGCRFHGSPLFSLNVQEQAKDIRDRHHVLALFREPSEARA